MPRSGAAPARPAQRRRTRGRATAGPESSAGPPPPAHSGDRSGARVVSPPARRRRPTAAIEAGSVPSAGPPPPRGGAGVARATPGGRPSIGYVTVLGSAPAPYPCLLPRAIRIMRRPNPHPSVAPFCASRLVRELLPSRSSIFLFPFLSSARQLRRSQHSQAHALYWTSQRCIVASSAT